MFDIDPVAEQRDFRSEALGVGYFFQLTRESLHPPRNPPFLETASNSFPSQWRIARWVSNVRFQSWE